MPLPPGPSSALLATVGYLRRPMASIGDMAARYGDPFTAPSLQGPVVVTGDPDGAKAIFGADPDTFKSSAGEIMEPIIGRYSVLSLSGAEHREARRLLLPPFHGERMRHYGQLMARAALRRAREWQDGRPMVMREAAREISMEVIAEAVMGVSDEARLAAMCQALVDLLGGLGPFLATFKWLQRDFGGIGPWARFRRRKGKVEELLREEMAARRERPGERVDVLSMLMEARHEDQSPMSEREILDEMFTLLVAGHDTTATALAWALYFVHRNPEVLARLRDEAPPAREGEPDAAALAGWRYLEAVCQETLRLRPLVPINSRVLVRPFTLKGWELPAKVAVGASASLVHMRPEIYPEPERFRPERFLERSYSAFELFPFGGGARRCIGAAFAMYEMKIVLGTVIGARSLRLLDGEVRPVLGLGTVGPATGVRMAAEPQRAAG